MHLLKIKVLDTCPNREFVIDYYQNKAKNLTYSRDSGVDLVFPEDMELLTNDVTKCHLGIACELFLEGETESSGYYLAPRSSITNYPVELANSIGIMDASYRGEVIASLRCYIDRRFRSTIDEFKYVVTKGSRLVQIIASNLKPIQIELVDELSSTDRGSNGFGSTDARV